MPPAASASFFVKLYEVFQNVFCESSRYPNGYSVTNQPKLRRERTGESEVVREALQSSCFARRDPTRRVRSGVDFASHVFGSDYGFGKPFAGFQVRSQNTSEGRVGICGHHLRPGSFGSGLGNNLGLR